MRRLRVLQLVRNWRDGIDFDTGANSGHGPPLPEVAIRHVVDHPHHELGQHRWFGHRTAGTFPTGYDICSDTLSDHAIVTLPTPVHLEVENGRALFGQITTCEELLLQGVHQFPRWHGGVVTVSCTDGFVDVEDLCAPMIDPQIEVMEDIECFGDAASFGVVPNDPALPFTSTVEYSLFEVTADGAEMVSQQVGNPEFTGVQAGEYFVTMLDTARTAAWSSNTCMDTTANVVFIDPEEIALSVDLTQDNLCGGEDIATICFDASGGTGALSTVAVPRHRSGAQSGFRHVLHRPLLLWRRWGIHHHHHR